MNNSLLIGMVHLPCLQYWGESNLDQLIAYTIEETRKLETAGFNAVMIENYNDSPFTKNRVGDDILVKLAIILHEVKKHVGIKIGLNILRNACTQAMTVASVLDIDFIRCNIFESAYVTDQGIIESEAVKVIEIKNKLNSDVKIMADIFVKHATPLANFAITDAAENVIRREKADYVIVSGTKTGSQADFTQIDSLNEIDIYPIIGSGMTEDNLSLFAGKIAGMIVGTSIKEGSKTTNPIDLEKATKLVETWKSLLA